MSEESNPWLAVGLTLTILTALHKRRRAKKNSLHNSEFTNPAVQGVNREATHAMLCGFATEQDARRYVAQPQCSSYLRDINGGWKFRLFENVDAAFQFKAKCTFASMSAGSSSGNRKKPSTFFERDVFSGPFHNRDVRSSSSEDMVDVHIDAEELDDTEGLTTVRVPSNWQLQVPGDSPSHEFYVYLPSGPTSSA